MKYKIFKTYLFMTFLLCGLLAIQNKAAPGDLDLTFGANGKVLTQIGTSQDEGRALAIQTDGKIVVAGFTDPGFFIYDFALARYNTDGSLDQTFGNGGKVITNLGFNGSAQSSDQAFDIAIQTDGKIVVAGWSNFNTGSSQNFDFAVVRYMSNGSLDSTFGNNGVVTTPIGTGNDAVNSLVIQTDGKIIAAGGAADGTSNPNFAVVRYNSNGSLDTAFNGTGKVTTPITNGSSVRDAALQSNGKIVAVGTGSQTGHGFVTVRYNSDGSLDDSFGIQFYPVSANSYFANSFALQTDDKIVVFGNASQAVSGFDFTIVRLGADGGVDLSFGSNGQVTTPISTNRADKANTGIIQPDGKIIAAGSAEVGAANDPDFALVRYHSDGSLDTTFGTNGIVKTGISATDNDDVVYGIAVQPDSKIVAAGQSRSIGANGSAQDFALARYQGDLSACFGISIPSSQTAIRNALTTIPVNINGDTTGQGIYSFDFTLTYDPDILDFQFPNPGGTASSGFTVTVNESTSGILKVSGFGTNPMSSTGLMLKMNFIATGAIGTISPLNFSNFQLNEGSPCSTTQNGQAAVSGGSISGTITYGTSLATTPVENVTVTAAGTPGVFHTTGVDGNYLLGGLSTGAYTVTPSKSSDVNGITALDASLVVQHVISLVTLNPNQQIAADASGNNTISSFDASLIARFAIGSPNTLLTGTWNFSPANRTYNNITSDLTGENYTAILVGEVSGNWTPPASQRSENEWLNLYKNSVELSKLREERGISISIPNVSVSRSNIITVPIMLDNFSGQNITAYQFDLLYNSDILLPFDTIIDKNGTLSSDFAVETNSLEAGKLRVAVYGANALVGNGTLLKLRFKVVGQMRRNAELKWKTFQFNEGSPEVKTADGKVLVKKE